MSGEREGSFEHAEAVASPVCPPELEWGLRANLVDACSEAVAGAACWVIDLNQGNGSDRLLVLLRSRSGRLIEKWLARKALTNFRTKWLPPHLRRRCRGWATRQEAEPWADFFRGAPV